MRITHRTTHSGTGNDRVELIIEFGAGTVDPDRVADVAWEHVHQILTDAQAARAGADAVAERLAG